MASVTATAGEDGDATASLAARAAGSFRVQVQAVGLGSDRTPTTQTLQ